MEDNFEWSAKWAIGHSSGLITLWKLRLFYLVFSLAGEGFLRIHVIWRGKPFYLVNVYASRMYAKNKEMWNRLMKLKIRFQQGDWCVGDDFNFVCIPSERKGISVVLGV